MSLSWKKPDNQTVALGIKYSQISSRLDIEKAEMLWNYMPPGFYLSRKQTLQFAGKKKYLDRVCYEQYCELT